jgi:hypothetical protein
VPWDQVDILVLGGYSSNALAPVRAGFQVVNAQQLELGIKVEGRSSRDVVIVWTEMKRGIFWNTWDYSKHLSNALKAEALKLKAVVVVETLTVHVHRVSICGRAISQPVHPESLPYCKLSSTESSSISCSPSYVKKNSHAASITNTSLK